MTSGQQGVVVRVTGGEVWVDVAGTTVACRLRGRLRQERGLQLAAGDRVEISRSDRDGESAIEAVSPRESWLSRHIERGGGGGERVIVANVETLFVVATLYAPPVQYSFIDRVLVSAEYGHARACIVLNKSDLATPAEVGDFVSAYRSCGYDVEATSAVTGHGIDGLSGRIGAGVYAFAGASGVGKSTLLMRIDPSLEISTRDIGEKTGRGRHTTTASQLYRFRGGFLADTPGVQTFGFAGDDPAGLPWCFPDFRSHAEECRFQPCTHSHEPGCRVKEAHAEGIILGTRYESYLQILRDVTERSRRQR